MGCVPCFGCSRTMLFYRSFGIFSFATGKNIMAKSLIRLKYVKCVKLLLFRYDKDVLRIYKDGYVLKVIA